MINESLRSPFLVLFMGISIKDKYYMITELMHTNLYNIIHKKR